MSKNILMTIMFKAKEHTSDKIIANVRNAMEKDWDIKEVPEKVKYTFDNGNIANMVNHTNHNGDVTAVIVLYSDYRRFVKGIRTEDVLKKINEFLMDKVEAEINSTGVYEITVQSTFTRETPQKRHLKGMCVMANRSTIFKVESDTYTPKNGVFIDNIGLNTKQYSLVERHFTVN